MAKKLTEKEQEKLLEMYDRIKKSSIYFVGLMWGLIPQPPKEEYEDEVKVIVEAQQYKHLKAEMFQPFEKGEHISWQQWIILLMVDDAVNFRGSRRISVASGHGVGKSCALSWIMIWFLHAYPLSQIPCTAPSREQMYDVLWKEASKWISAMPERYRNNYDIQASYIRMLERPLEWFARAKTARKESPEALAGVHGENVLLLVDEASGVADEIFETGQGSLTEENYIMIMISNPTRQIGYFYDSHHKMKSYWATASFSSIDSPVVRGGFEKEIADQYGRDSDEYRIRVLGKFPKEGSVDDKGYVPLLVKADIKQIDEPQNDYMLPSAKMGVDPAGEGIDETSWVVRDAFHGKIVLREKVSTPKSIAQKTVTLMKLYDIPPENVFIDMFGVGADTVKELALYQFNVNGVNVGEKPDKEKDQKRFLNKRACFYFRLRKWLKEGGELIRHRKWEEELPSNRYRRALSGKIQMMSKRDMKSTGYKSPNHADALMLTFAREDELGEVRTVTPSTINKRDSGGEEAPWIDNRSGTIPQGNTIITSTPYGGRHSAI